MMKLSLAVIMTLGAISAAQAADTKVSVDPPTVAGCRQARAILADRQRIAIDGTFHFVDGDNMVCFRPPQPARVVLKPSYDPTPVSYATPRPAVVTTPISTLTPKQQAALPPVSPASIPRVAGDGIPFRGAMAFETGHSVALTDTSKLGTRIGGNLSADRVSFNSVELRLAQRF